jgi:hypothetical protein
MSGTAKKVKLKGTALPNEHGSWGFLFEPLVGALAVAFSVGGIFLALMVIGAFLLRQPLKVIFLSWKTGRNLPQKPLAVRSAFLYSLIFITGLAGSVWYSSLLSFVPFLLMIPLAIYQVYCDVSQKTREVLPEITGAVAISSSSAAIALSGGWAWPASFALWVIFICRLIPSIIYVRNRLLAEKGKVFSQYPTMAVGGLAILLIVGLYYFKLSPLLPIVATVVLFGRAFWGLSNYRVKTKAMIIGVWEVIYGLIFLIAVIAGYRFGL